MNLQEFKKSGYKLKLVTAVDFIISDVIIDDTDSELTEDTVNDLNTEFEEAVVGSATESFYQIFDENDDLMFDELSEEDVVKIINELSYGCPVINSAKEDPTNINGYTDAEKEAIIAFSKEIGFSCNPIMDQARCLFDDRYTLDYEEQEVVENATLLTETFLAEMYNRDATSLLDYVPYEVYDGSPGVKTYYVFEKENNHDLLLETESEEEYVNFVKSLFESLVDELTKKLEEK